MYNVYAGLIAVGRHDVQMAAKQVARLHYVEAQMMRVAAGRLALIPEWEAKLLLGRHLWQDSLHADQLLKRLVDLRWPRTAPLDPGEPMRRLMAELDEAPETAAFLAAMYRVLKPRLAAAYAAYAGGVASVDDEPTQTLVDELLEQERRQVTEGEELLESMPKSTNASAIDDWLHGFERAYTVTGGLAGDPDEVTRELKGSFEGIFVGSRPDRAARDSRFRWSDDPSEGVPGDEAGMTRFIAHRDADNEMHAAEVLGRNIYENPDLPWEYHVDMARQLYDEVRHAVLYEKYLEALGGHMGDFPVIPGNYAYRMGLDLTHRMYDLHLRGERLGMPDLMRYRREARDRGDTMYALLNDYVHADEVPHVKNGRWLKWLLKDDEEAFKRVERETMEIRAEYERAHPTDPIVQRYTGLAVEKGGTATR